MTPGEGRLPTFFLAGVPKAGTSSLYAYLQQHPQIYMCWPKEPTFFGAVDILSDANGDRLVRQSMQEVETLHPHWKGLVEPDRMWAVAKWEYVPGRRWVVAKWEDYLDLFQRVREETAIGDASVDHFWLPSAAEAIHANVPDARLIFVLRDPAQRLFSEYAANLWDRPRLQTFRAQFLEAADRPDPWRGLRVLVGRYAAHLQRYAALFPRTHFRVYLYEDYCANARSVLRDIFEFLEVDPDQPLDMSRRHNVPVVPRFPRLHALRRRLLGEAALTTRLPEPARRLLVHLYRGPRAAMTMDPADRAMVIDYYREQIRDTADFIGRDLSAWLR